MELNISRAHDSPCRSLLMVHEVRTDIASDDMDIRVKYAGMFHRKKGIISSTLLMMVKPCHNMLI